MSTTSLGGRGSRDRPRPTEAPAPGADLVFDLLGAVARLLWAGARHPIVVAVALGVTAAVYVAGPFGTVGLVACFGFVLLLWRRVRPASWQRFAVSRWRAAVVYRRRWQPAMATCGLAVTLDGHRAVPFLGRVVSTPWVDRVLVQLLVGQSPEDYEAATSRLAHAFGAGRCRVVVDRPGRVWLEFTHRDPLQTVIPALNTPVADFAAVPVGRCEDGTTWTVRLAGTHLLIAGSTGSGKGSVVWSLVRSIGPAVRDRSVEIWAVDPKGGMELAPGSALFTRFACESSDAMVALLEDAVAVLRARTSRLRGAGSRTHLPTVEDPLVVLLVDEMAALTAYLGDRELKRRAQAALQVLLSQGRAAGVTVVAAVQDPGKDVVAFRDLFPTRVALRLLEDVQVDMVLGRSARQHGAECDRIPPSLPGVGYVMLDGTREPVRVRAAYVDDDALAQMTREYEPVRAS